MDRGCVLFKKFNSTSDTEIFDEENSFSLKRESKKGSDGGVGKDVNELYGACGAASLP